MTASPIPVLPPLSAVTVAVAGLVVDRGGRRVLDGIDLTLAAGDALLLTGPNGVGKSTLIRALFGLVHPVAGDVRVRGDGIPDDAELAPYCHYLGHRDAVKPALSVAENLAFWRDFLGDRGGATVDLALDAVDLADLADLPAAWLSAGQRRRLSIARLLVSPRPVWLLDEPTAALDRESEARFVALMGAHLAAGGALVAATHLPIALAGARGLRLGPPARTGAFA
jgi:heme exporter protein A